MFPKILKILLIEDNPGDARLIREMLTAEGQGHFEMEWVTRLADGLERLGRGGIDLVLLDLGLPDSQGLDTFIQASWQYPQVPFVVLTGLADEDMGVTAVSQGAQDYLIKGEVDGKPLLRAIRYATERKRVEEALRQAHDKLAQANWQLNLEVEERRRAQKELESEKQKLFSVLDTIPAFVHLKGADFTIQFANRRFREVFGEPGNRRCYELLSDRSEPCKHCRVLEVLKTKAPQKLETTSLNARAYEIYHYPFCAEDDLLVLTLGMDITERKEAEEALRATQEHLQESEKNLRFLASKLLSSQERERTRISRDLHDVLVQSLLCLKIEARAMERKLESDPHPQQVKADFDIMHASLDGLIDQVRRLSRDLSPHILEDLGITAALKHLFHEFARHHPGCRWSLELDEIDGLFSKEDQLTIYRIFQEALTNIGKYAQATQISGVVSHKENGVSFLVEDNGRGFDVHQALTADVTGRGLGLASMQERVRMLGGKLQLWSEVGSGTRISFNILVDGHSEKPMTAN